jgi:hypothetical protein
MFHAESMKTPRIYLKEEKVHSSKQQMFNQDDEQIRTQEHGLSEELDDFGALSLQRKHNLEMPSQDAEVFTVGGQPAVVSSGQLVENKNTNAEGKKGFKFGDTRSEGEEGFVFGNTMSKGKRQFSNNIDDMYQGHTTISSAVKASSPIPRPVITGDNNATVSVDCVCVVESPTSVGSPSTLLDQHSSSEDPDIRLIVHDVDSSVESTCMNDMDDLREHSATASNDYVFTDDNPVAHGENGNVLNVSPCSVEVSNKVEVERDNLALEEVMENSGGSSIDERKKKTDRRTLTLSADVEVQEETSNRSVEHCSLAPCCCKIPQLSERSKRFIQPITSEENKHVHRVEKGKFFSDVSTTKNEPNIIASSSSSAVMSAQGEEVAASPDCLRSWAGLVRQYSEVVTSFLHRQTDSGSSVDWQPTHPTSRKPSSSKTYGIGGQACETSGDADSVDRETDGEIQKDSPLGPVLENAAMPEGLEDAKFETDAFFICQRCGGMVQGQKVSSMEFEREYNSDATFSKERIRNRRAALNNHDRRKNDLADNNENAGSDEDAIVDRSTTPTRDVLGNGSRGDDSDVIKEVFDVEVDKMRDDKETPIEQTFAVHGEDDVEEAINCHDENVDDNDDVSLDLHLDDKCLARCTHGDTNTNADSAGLSNAPSDDVLAAVFIRKPFAVYFHGGCIGNSY